MENPTLGIRCWIVRRIPTGIHRFDGNLHKIRSDSSRIQVGPVVGLNLLGREFVTNETIKRADIMFQRLYNERDDIVLTPSSGTESSIVDDDEYRETFDTHSPSPQRGALEDFQQMLRNQGFNGRVRQSLSYSSSCLKYQRDCRTRIKKIFLHLAKLLAPDDYDEVWHGIIDDENKNNDLQEDKYICLLCCLSNL